MSLGLRVEWYDPQPMLTREFVMRIYAEERQVEMYDAHSRRTFLKKSPLPDSICVSDLCVGNEIVLHSRTLKIVQYADQATEDVLSKTQATSTCVIPPECVSNGKLGSVVSVFENAGLTIKKLRMVALSATEADELSLLMRGDAGDLSSGNCVFMTVTGTNVVKVMEKICHTNSTILCESSSSAASLDKLAFGLEPLATCGPDSTCCVVRPHIMASKQLGAVLSHIESTRAYKIAAMGLFRLDVAMASEFLAVYDGVMPDFASAVKQLSSGRCCAIELAAKDAVSSFRKTAGPWDVNFAREIRPKTIRAKFGVSSIDNAVHCTDLTDAAESELRYFFDVLKPC
mmetsp:Transcript_12236/g.36721  ORF Transcript_12236/g.36721 Transcript_12236/m.36721 type:complete len:343 (-) Transcript_12236:15-1043(-)